MRLKYGAAVALAALIVALPSFAGIERVPLERGIGDRDDDGITVQVVGRVQSLFQGGFLVKTPDFIVRVIDERKTLGAERTLLSDRPKVGDRVRVWGELAEAERTGGFAGVAGERYLRERVLASRIEILNRTGGLWSRGLIGSIRSIDSEERQLSIATPDGNRRVEWDDNTEFTRNKLRRGPKEFRIGDSVRIAGRKRGDGTLLARRITFGGDPGWENNAVGEIVSLDRRTKQADIDFDGDVETVKLANATLRRRGGTRMDFEDLKIGWDVRIQGERLGKDSVDASQLDLVRLEDGDGGDETPFETFEGRIDQIFSEIKAFRLRRSEGETIRVIVQPDTNIVRGINKLTFASLKKEDRVRVRGRIRKTETGIEQVLAGRVELL